MQIREVLTHYNTANYTSDKITTIADSFIILSRPYTALYLRNNRAIDELRLKISSPVRVYHGQASCVPKMMSVMALTHINIPVMASR